MPFATTWMELEDIMLSEISQSDTYTHTHTHTHIWVKFELTKRNTGARIPGLWLQGHSLGR